MKTNNRMLWIAVPTIFAMLLALMPIGVVSETLGYSEDLITGNPVGIDWGESVTYAFDVPAGATGVMLAGIGRNGGYSYEDGAYETLKLEVGLSGNLNLIDTDELSHDPDIGYVPNYGTAGIYIPAYGDGTNSYYGDKTTSFPIRGPQGREAGWLLENDNDFTPNNGFGSSPETHAYYKPDCLSYEYMWDITQLVTKGSTNTLEVSNIDVDHYRTIYIKELRIDVYMADSEVKTKTKCLDVVGFYDDFESGTLDKWTHVSGSNAVETENSDKVLEIDGSAYVGELISTSGSESWTDYVYEFDAKKVSGQYAYSVFRHKTNSGVTYGADYYLLESTTTSGGLLKLYKRAGGTQYGPIQSVFVMTEGTWYHFRIELSGNDVKVLIDGDSYIDITDDGTLSNFGPAVTQGKVGLGNYYGSVSRFDDVKVSGKVCLDFTSSFRFGGTSSGDTYMIMVEMTGHSTNLGDLTVEDVDVHRATPKKSVTSASVVDHGIGSGLTIQPGGTISFSISVTADFSKIANIHLWVDTDYKGTSYNIGTNVMLR